MIIIVKNGKILEKNNLKKEEEMVMEYINKGYEVEVLLNKNIEFKKIDSNQKLYLYNIGSNNANYLYIKNNLLYAISKDKKRIRGLKRIQL